jgi:phospholipid transport system substrate-binding protein
MLPPTRMGRALAAWLMVASAMAATSPTPRETVQTAVGQVIAVLQEDVETAHLDRPRSDGRRAEIRRLAGELFDFDEMARRTLTRHWSARTPEERVEFVHLFTDLLERSYITRIEQWSGERVLYPSESVDGHYATVRSRIVTRRRTEIAVDYRLLLRDGRWRVYDVLLDGVSFVATFRSEFDRIINQASYAGLVDKLRRRTAGTAVIQPAAAVR